MFNFKKNEIDLALDAEITALLAKMGEQDKTSEEYAKMVDQFNKLYELRHKSRISKDALATIGANLLGILVVLQHERVHVIASKAFGFVKKIN